MTIYQIRRTWFTKPQLVFLLMIFLLINSACTPQTQPFFVIFSAKLDGNQDLYRASGHDFQSIERLTFTPDNTEKGVKLSRDGQYLLYSVLLPNIAYSSTIIDLKTKESTNLDNPAVKSGETLGWSADGNRAILLDEHAPALYAIKLDGKLAESLDIPHNFDYSVITQLDYSPDGTKIAFTEYHQPIPPSSTMSVFIFDPETKLNTPLVDNHTATCYNAKWSPIGLKIIVYCDLDSTNTAPNRHIYLFEISDRSPIQATQIADLPCRNNFVWSPFGKRFVAYCNMNSKIPTPVIFNSDGNLEMEFSSFTAKDESIRILEMAWSPDEQKILYTAGNDSDFVNIFMMNIDGSNNHSITKQPSNYKQLSTYSVLP